MFLSNAYLRGLLEGCRRNDRISQGKLYELLNGFALKTCYAYRSEPLQDIVHEAFIKLFRHIEQFDENRYQEIYPTLKGWFKRILINTCIDQYRKTSKREIYTLDKQSENISAQNSSGFDSLSYKELLQAIRELSPAYRMVFNLFVIEGLSHDEISKKLGISVGASKSNLSKARERLKSILAQKAQWNQSHLEATAP